VTDDGDWAFNATGHLAWTKQEKWDRIPEGKRDSRDVIKAAGDAYLDSWGDGNVKVPYGTPCARLEGKKHIWNSSSRALAKLYTRRLIYGWRKPGVDQHCKMPQFPQPFKITNRRYVIDEEIGGLDIFDNFPFIEKTNQTVHPVPTSLGWRAARFVISTRPLCVLRATAEGDMFFLLILR
jgi:hypothetical protein